MSKSLVNYSDESDQSNVDGDVDREVTPPSSFDLSQVLDCKEGEDIREYYAKYDILSPKMAKRLVVLIVNYLFDQKIPGSRRLFREISIEISMVFLKECPVSIICFYVSHKHQ